LNYFTFVVVGVVVVVDKLVVDVLVVDEVVVDVLVVVNASVDVSVVVETTASACDVSVSNSNTAAVPVVGATVGGGASSCTVWSVTTSADGGVTVAAGGDDSVAGLLEACGDVGRAFTLLRATVGRFFEAALVAFLTNRLDAALQRFPPQHRMIQLRAPCNSIFKHLLLHFGCSF
jgi:hypothetical protein